MPKLSTIAIGVAILVAVLYFTGTLDGLLDKYLVANQEVTQVESVNAISPEFAISVIPDYDVNVSITPSE